MSASPIRLDLNAATDLLDQGPTYDEHNAEIIKDSQDRIGHCVSVLSDEDIDLALDSLFNHEKRFQVIRNLGNVKTRDEQAALLADYLLDCVVANDAYKSEGDFTAELRVAS